MQQEWKNFCLLLLLLPVIAFTVFMYKRGNRVKHDLEANDVAMCAYYEQQRRIAQQERARRLAANPRRQWPRLTIPVQNNGPPPPPYTAMPGQGDVALPAYSEAEGEVVGRVGQVRAVPTPQAAHARASARARQELHADAEDVPRPSEFVHNHGNMDD